MSEFNDHREAAKTELKRLEKLEKKLANLEKPRSWERFKAFFNGGTKKVTADTKTAKTNLEQDITQKTAPDFLTKYQDWKQRVDEAVQKEIKNIRTQKAQDMKDTFAELGFGGQIKEKPEAPKQTTQGTPTAPLQPLTLQEVLSDREMATALEKFTQKEMSPENLRFYQAVESFKADVKAGVIGIEELKETAKEITARFVRNDGEERVTIDNDRAQQGVFDAIENFNGETTREELGDLFNAAQDETYGMLEGTLQRFQGTTECKQIRARYEQDGPSENVRNKMGYKPKVGGATGTNKITM